MTCRSPAVAGSFYPENPKTLHNMVQQMLDHAPRQRLHAKALIVPHAGYIYSGPIAATAYNCLLESIETISRVVLLGPSHRVALSGIAIPTWSEFQTPLGNIPLDRESIDYIANLEGVEINNAAHAMEHSLEVQLPFLQEMLSDFQLVPLVVGQCSAKVVANVLNHLWGGEETLIIISSDLSHYHQYVIAQQLDQETSRKIEGLETNIQGEQACGCYPLNGLLLAAKQHGLKPDNLDLCNSGDTAGNKDQVVGYGAYALH